MVTCAELDCSSTLRARSFKVKIKCNSITNETQLSVISSWVQQSTHLHTRYPQFHVTCDVLMYQFRFGLFRVDSDESSCSHKYAAGKCYSVHKASSSGGVSWYTARSLCKGGGGDLLQVSLLYSAVTSRHLPSSTTRNLALTAYRKHEKTVIHRHMLYAMFRK